MESNSIYTCIVIDDDPLFLRTLTTYVREISWLSMTAVFDNPIKGASAIVNMKPDIVFLDIAMPHVDGHYLIDWIGPKIEKMYVQPKVVIISALTTLPEELTSKVFGFIHKGVLKDPETLALEMKRMGF